MRRLMSLLAVLLLFAAGSLALQGAQGTPPYRNASLSIDERVADLLSRMTIEEKVAQLEGIWQRKSQFQDAF